MYCQHQLQPNAAKMKPTGADVVSLICLDFHKPSINQRRCITLALFKQY